MKLCKICGHEKKIHYGIDGLCMHTNKDALWDCECEGYKAEK